MKDELPAVHFAFLWRDWLTPCRKKRGVRRVEEDSKWLGFDILWVRVFPDVSHESHAMHCGCLLPRQTGRAAFPHPAFAGIVALGFAGSCATVARRGRQPSC
jgi:hypothetical protein